MIIPSISCHLSSAFLISIFISLTRVFGTLSAGALNPMNEIALMLWAVRLVWVLIIIFGMVLNVINALRSKELGEALFGHNGVAGLRSWQAHFSCR